MKKGILLLLAVNMMFLLLSCGSQAALPEAAANLSANHASALAQVQESRFTDVAEDAPYAQAVKYCHEHGLMNGTSATTFSPDGTTTRAQIVTILWRQAGSPAAGAARFSDVSATAYYKDAVAWADGQDIVAGYTDGRFGPDDPITRTQLLTILWRSSGSPAVSRQDAVGNGNSIAACAVDAVAWAKENGIVSDENGDALNHVATRAQTATVLYHYLSNSTQIDIKIGSTVLSATLADNSSAKEFAALLADGPVTVEMQDYNDFEKFGDLPKNIVRNDKKITTVPGDLILYQGKSITIYYDENTVDFTRLGKINGVTQSELKAILGDEDVTAIFSLHQKEPVNMGTFDLKAKTVLLNSGYEMPIMGLGTYSLSDNECRTSIAALLESGGRLIDTAYMYHNEAAVGQAVRESSVPREEIFVTTKLYPNQFANAAEAIDDALEKMDIEYIDLMLLHHPGTNDVEAYKAMEQAVEDGKIRSIGLSNWYVAELTEFLPQITIIPAVVQNEIHPYYQENDVIPFIQEKGIVVEGWYPLGGRGHTGELLGNKTISAIAAAHSVSSAQVILRWNLQKGVVVIPGSSDPDHIKENLDLFSFSLTDEEMTQINALDRGEKHDWY